MKRRPFFPIVIKINQNAKGLTHNRFLCPCISLIQHDSKCMDFFLPCFLMFHVYHFSPEKPPEFIFTTYVKDFFQENTKRASFVLLIYETVTKAISRRRTVESFMSFFFSSLNQFNKTFFLHIGNLICNGQVQFQK